MRNTSYVQFDSSTGEIIVSDLPEKFLPHVSKLLDHLALRFMDWPMSEELLGEIDREVQQWMFKMVDDLGL